MENGMFDLRDSINRLCQFLAVRDFEQLTKRELSEKKGIEKADVLMVFGNELLTVIETAADALDAGLADYLLFCGGVGHGTVLLRENAIADNRYRLLSEQISSLSEAEISREIAVRYNGVSEERILVETSSTNCGENSRNGVQLLKDKGIPMNHIILLQDPLMQRRSYESLKYYVSGDCQVYNYASFVPGVDEQLKYLSSMPETWEEERFFTLISGELSRLRDDEKGYGPKGKNFIGHVEIPETLLADYEAMKRYRPGYNDRIL
ncbi:YdcF family protein [Lacrimispora sp.]|uniref:YdcF family protein n=1 Tax=Lacrimispora sp. TaxID=2719234 RepID=UPI00289FBAE9|nr:YdcF family protein [Lacrimispora sp.]